MRVLVTGAAGFIGAAVSKALVGQGHQVCGIDNLNDYYDISLKKFRLQDLSKFKEFTFTKCDIKNNGELTQAFVQFRPEQVVHLAAQAGVRYSIENPQVYIDANIQGFFNILELCRRHPVQHLVFASSSSVYGANTKVPFSESDSVDHPVSLYAATKKSNELMAHSYSDLYGIPVTGLRFFTVYGPIGRPDMAYFSFTKKIISGESIELFNHGQHKRDFTYIDDVVNGVVSVVFRPAQRMQDWAAAGAPRDRSRAPYRIYNIGNNSPVWMKDFVAILEQLIGKKANIKPVEMKPGDVFETYADISRLEKDFGFRPNTKIEVGLEKFVQWYVDYYEGKSR